MILKQQNKVNTISDISRTTYVSRDISIYNAELLVLVPVFRMF